MNFFCEKCIFAFILHFKIFFAYLENSLKKGLNRKFACHCEPHWLIMVSDTLKSNSDV